MAGEKAFANTALVLGYVRWYLQFMFWQRHMSVESHKSHGFLLYHALHIGTTRSTEVSGRQGPSSVTLHWTSKPRKLSTFSTFLNVFFSCNSAIIITSSYMVVLLFVLRNLLPYIRYVPWGRLRVFIHHGIRGLTTGGTNFGCLAFRVLARRKETWLCSGLLPLSWGWRTSSLMHSGTLLFLKLSKA